MIPLHNKELLIKNLEAGQSIVEACQTSQVSKASLYRLFKTQPGFKEDVDRAMFKGTQKVQVQIKKLEDKNMEELKKIINRRR